MSAHTVGYTSRRFLEACVRAVSRNLPVITLAAATITYVVYWSWIDWLRLITFHFPVYDLGISYQAIWAAAHGHSIYVAGPSYTDGILYLFVAPYYAIGSQQDFLFFLLVFQNAFLALGVVPIYLLSNERFRMPWIGSLLGLVFLLYIPSNGIVFFPFHFEGLFPTLFLFGYLLYRRKLFAPAFVVFSLSSLTEIGTLAVLFFFALGIVGEPLIARLATRIWHGSRGARARVDLTRAWFALALVTEVLVVFLVYISIGGYQNVVAFALHAPTGTLSQSAGAAFPLSTFLTGWQIKLVTLDLIFVPVLALPVLAREERWALVPYVGLILFGGSFGIFSYPFRDQYTSLLVGPLFAAVIRGAERLSPRTPESPAEDTRKNATATPGPRRSPWKRPARFHLEIRRSRLRDLASSCLVVSVVLALFFSPWGPLNEDLSHNPVLLYGYYDLSSFTTGNLTLDSHISTLIADIPPDGWLLVQNNLPQAVGRQQFIVPGFYNLNVPLQYLVADPYGDSFYPGTNFGPYNNSMMYWANYYLQHGWSVAGEADGALLLSNASTSMKVYYPISQTFLHSQFLCCSISSEHADLTNFTGYYVAGLHLPLEGAYSVYSPGEYNLSVHIMVDHPGSMGTVSLQVGSDWGGKIVAYYNHGAAIWSNYSGPATLNDNVTITQYLEGMFLAIYLYNWSGPLTFLDIQVSQVKPA